AWGTRPAHAPGRRDGAGIPRARGPRRMPRGRAGDAQRVLDDPGIVKPFVECGAQRHITHGADPARDAPEHALIRTDDRRGLRDLSIDAEGPLKPFTEMLIGWPSNQFDVAGAALMQGGPVRDPTRKQLRHLLRSDFIDVLPTPKGGGFSITRRHDQL